MQSRSIVKLAAVAVIAAGCGRLGFDPSPEGGVPRIPPALGDPAATEVRPWASTDLRELVFASDRAGGAGGFDIWCATRDSIADDWGTPEPVTEINSAGDETGAAISTDGRTLWLASSRDRPFGDTDLWVATRPDRDHAWSRPVHIPELSSDADDGAPAPSSDDLELVFDSKRAGGAGERDLYIVRRSAVDAPWSEPRQITELATAANDADAFITSSGNLLFDSNREDDFRELYFARRGDEGFEPPERFPLFDSERADADPWLSPDGRYLLFLSSRTRDDEIYEVQLATPIN